jgi:hypothetical protein
MLQFRLLAFVTESSICGVLLVAGAYQAFAIERDLAVRNGCISCSG